MPDVFERVHRRVKEHNYLVEFLEKAMIENYRHKREE
jgi:hypothetical protein